MHAWHLKNKNASSWRLAIRTNGVRVFVKTCVSKGFSIMGKPNAIDQVSSPEWAKHLRPRGKKTYWRRVRQSVKKQLARAGTRAED